MNINRWREFFPPEQLFIGFFEDIRSNPADLLEKIFAFLQVDNLNHTHAEERNKRYNASPYSEIPKIVLHELARLNLENIKQLASDVKGYPELWLQECEEILAG